MSKHTPGPWRVAECGTRGCWCRTIVADVPDILDDEDSDFHIISSGSLRKHNANLVAAAPELLDALTGALEMLETLQARGAQVSASGRSAMSSYRELIAKATGETL